MSKGSLLEKFKFLGKKETQNPNKSISKLSLEHYYVIVNTGIQHPDTPDESQQGKADFPNCSHHDSPHGCQGPEDTTIKVEQPHLI